MTRQASPLILFLTTILITIPYTYADLGPFLHDPAFDNGTYGLYVPEVYHSTSISAPRPNLWETRRGSCQRSNDDGLLVMLALRGWAVPHPGPMILDGRGGLVWTDPSYVQPYNLQVQTYRGERFLTFWAGDDGVKGHGKGVYYMLDSHYTQRYRLTGGNGLDGDLHEFRITTSGTALITVYQTTQANLTSVGKSAHGWIWDGLFQELDIETNAVLFQWRASDHLAFTESYWGPGTLGDTKDDAWDWFHINSVEKDNVGNYLVSSRWLHAILYINGTSGDVIWRLGGKMSDFRDLSDDGHNSGATSFASQHHARWHDGFTSITLFDNSDPGPGYPSAGVWLDLDLSAMTVKLRKRYLSLNRTVSGSQGSMQTLPSGNVLVGYGMDAQYVEFSRAGQVLCEVHLGPPAHFDSAPLQSYRVEKYAWVGRPVSRPDINQVNGTIYLSWNGATEIRYWMLEESDTEEEEEEDDDDDDPFREVWRVRKLGFETAVPNSRIEKAYVRAVALDKEGNVLGTTRAVLKGELVQDTATQENEDGGQEAEEDQQSTAEQSKGTTQEAEAEADSETDSDTPEKRHVRQHLALAAMALVVVPAVIWLAVCLVLGLRCMAGYYSYYRGKRKGKGKGKGGYGYGYIQAQHDAVEGRSLVFENHVTV